MVTIETITGQVVDLVRSHLKRVQRVSAPEGLLHAVVYDPEKLKEFGDTEELYLFAKSYAEFFGLIDGLSEDNVRERVFGKLDESFETDQREGVIIRGRGLKAWDVQAALADSYYWESLRGYWRDDSHLGDRVIETIHNDTNKILSWCGNPSQMEGTWQRTGLVMGHVQSGKTTNYSALIAKAIDSGYRCIVILAGITNSLRRQTQERIDANILGWNSSDFELKRPIGVASYRGGESQLSLVSLTDEGADFAKSNRTATTEAASQCIIAVVKKNSRILGNFNKWLVDLAGSRKRLKYPLLVIDDEADSASIDTNISGDSPSAINAQIRNLLEKADRRTYVGYTATPFANIFIDPEIEEDQFESDTLFPRDFILSLNPASKYIGPHKIFDPDNELYEKCIFDMDEIENFDMYREGVKYSHVLPRKQNRQLRVDELPATLEDSVYLFVCFVAWRLKTATRDKHSSMLINVSILNSVQDQISRLVDILVGDLRKSAIAMANSPDWRLDPRLKRLEDVFKFYKYDQDMDLELQDLLPHLREAISLIEIRMINMIGDELRYQTIEGRGLFVIAIGGLALSRGLTLEGLAVSYVIRNVGAKDTLLQTARWFGYRPDYENLCRILMPNVLVGRFLETARTVEELRSDLARMVDVGLTPKEFGLRVRHSGFGLAITASNKRGTGRKIRVGDDFERTHYQCAELEDDPDKEAKNAEAIQEFLTDIVTRGDFEISPHVVDKPIVAKGIHFRGQFGEDVIRLLQTFNSPEAEFQIYSDEPGNLHGLNLISSYIKLRPAEMKTWDIAIVANTLKQTESESYSDAMKELCPRLLDDEIFSSELIEKGWRLRVRKSGAEQEGEGTYLITANRSVSGKISNDLIFGMDSIAQNALRDLAEKRQRELDEKQSSDVDLTRSVFDALERPILLIHPIMFGISNSSSHLRRIYTISIGFPQTEKRPTTREYFVNKVFQDRLERAEQLRMFTDEMLEV